LGGLRPEYGATVGSKSAGLLTTGLPKHRRQLHECALLVMSASFSTMLKSSAMRCSLLLLGVFTAQAAGIHQDLEDGAIQKFLNKKEQKNNAEEPVPIWHQQFSIQFNETTKIFVTKHTGGTWYYDAVNQKEALYRENGNGDRYCGSVHPLTQTPCLHIVTGGKRYGDVHRKLLVSCFRAWRTHRTLSVRSQHAPTGHELHVGSISCTDSVSSLKPSTVILTMTDF
jgi:hypothetical protein